MAELKDKMAEMYGKVPAIQGWGLIVASGIDSPRLACLICLWR
jgi:hypothetical protein